MDLNFSDEMYRFQSIFPSMKDHLYNFIFFKLCVACWKSSRKKIHTIWKRHEVKFCNNYIPYWSSLFRKESQSCNF